MSAIRRPKDFKIGPHTAEITHRPKFLPSVVHPVVSHPTYPAKNFLIESPLVYFLVCDLIKLTILVEISSWASRRELPITQLEEAVSNKHY